MFSGEIESAQGHDHPLTNKEILEQEGGMVVPDYYYTWKNAPGAKNKILRWIGYKVRYIATIVAIYAQRLIQTGQIEVKHELLTWKEMQKKWYDKYDKD